MTYGKIQVDLFGFHPAHITSQVNIQVDLFFGFYPAHKRVVDKENMEKGNGLKFLIFFQSNNT